MAFSIFLRAPGCTNVAFSQQIMKMATQPSLAHRAIATTLPARLMTIQKAKSTPIINSVRSFRTSCVRLSAEKGHDHSKLWLVEKATSALLIPLIPLGLLMPNKIIDATLAVLISAHTFWGLEAIAVDYVRASVFGPFIPKVALGLVYILCFATLGGLFYIISHDIGLANTFRQLWAIKSDSQKS